MFVVFYFLADGFGFHTIPVIIGQSVIPTILGLAMACVMKAGLIDFSPGARVIFAAIVGGIFAGYFGLAGMFVGCLVGAAVSALLLAVLYRYLRIPSLVVSLGLLLVLEAVSDRVVVFATGYNGTTVGDEIAAVASFPYNIAYVVVAGVIFYYLMYLTKIGASISAAGDDEAMLKNMGVKPDSVKFKAFMLSGLFCFLGAIAQLCYSGTVAAQTGMGTAMMIFKPLIGVLIALPLTRLIDNLPFMILVGEIVVATVFNGFIAMGLSSNEQSIVLGVFLVVVMGVSGNARAVAEWRRRRATRRHARLMVPASEDTGEAT